MLFGHFSDGSCVLDRAPFNVAWHTQAFGQSSRLISRIGDDLPGHEIAALIDAWEMSREALQRDGEHSTRIILVLIHNSEPHYEIIADSTYRFYRRRFTQQKSHPRYFVSRIVDGRDTVVFAAL